MTQVTRVFDNPGRASAALDDLKARGFDNAELAAAPNGRDKTMLRVDAPFGTALQVEDVLARHAQENAKGTAKGGGNGAAPALAAAKPAAPSSRASVVVTPTPPQPPQAGSPPGRPAATGARTEATKPQAAQPAASPRNGTHAGTRSGPRTLSQLLGIPELIDSDTFFSGFPLLIRPTPKRADQPAAKPD